MTTNNVFVDPPQRLPDELFTNLLDDAKMRIEESCLGCESPEWLAVHYGERQGCLHEQDSS